MTVFSKVSKAVPPKVRARGVWVLSSPSPEDLLQTITRPLELLGYTFEDDEIPTAMVEEVKDEEVSLPLLQFACSKLWEKRDQEHRYLSRKEFEKLGFKILATEGTHKLLTKNKVKSEHILKMHEGRPNILDSIKNGQIQLVVNTPSGKQSKYDDSYIRKAAIKYKIPYITTAAAAAAAAKGIAAFKEKPSQIKSLQEYHADIK